MRCEEGLGVAAYGASMIGCISSRSKQAEKRKGSEPAIAPFT